LGPAQTIVQVHSLALRASFRLIVGLDTNLHEVVRT
jgi:hypothetical protein